MVMREESNMLMEICFLIFIELLLYRGFALLAGFLFVSFGSTWECRLCIVMLEGMQ